MAILGILTDLGLSTAQDAASNNGFNLVPVSFAVSDQAGALDPTRTTPNAGQFFTAAISSRVVIDQNTIQFVLTIPPGQIPVGTFKIIREIYLNINDSLGNPFLFAIGQPTDEIRYNEDAQVTLQLEMAITNLDLTANFVFQFTQATEISEHNLDPNAHTEVVAALRKAGIFIPAGAFPFERRGQHFENNGGAGVEFDGVKSSILFNGVTFTSTFNGTELNGVTLTFDGVLTTDQVRAAFNALNFPNTVEHDGTGTEVLPAGTPSLSGGSYVVQDKDIVFKDIDGIYKQALADGTIKSRVAGIALRADKCVSTHGVHDINTGFGIGTPLFLSGTTPGKLVNFDTNVNMGLSLGTFIFFTGFSSDTSGSVSQQFDAVVTNSSGVGQFLTTQAAIDFVPTDGRILINKLENVKTPILTNGKNLTIEVNGPNKGWRKFAGLSTSWRVDFDLVPTQGTFRIEWNFQETNDLAFNATALDIQNEFNLLNGHNGFTVTGDFTTGFTFISNDLNIYPLPTFVFAGLNEIQRFDFDNVPDNGTIPFRHKGQTTVNFAWNDTTAQLKTDLEALSTIQNVIVTGSFATQFFQIEFDGGFLQDGLQEQTLLEAVTSDLMALGVATSVNGSTLFPVNATVVQKGKKPASNLFNNVTPIVVTVASLQVGEQVGSDTAMIVDSTNIRIGGLGRFENFINGIILQNPSDKIVVEAFFPGTTFPIETIDKLPGLNYSFDDVEGFAKDIFSQLRITEHPTNKKRVVISGADQIMASGITLTQEINSLLLDFDGAQIDFSTDPITIFKADGTTPLGLNATRPVIGAALWRWFTINIIPELENADQSLKGQVLILPASTDGTTTLLAEKAPFGDKPIGAIAIQGALGKKEKTIITTIKDTFNSLVGKTMTLFSPAESVAFWFSDPTLDTLQVEDTTGVTGVDENLFNSTTNKVLAGKISVVAPITIDKVNLFIKKIGAPTGTVSVRILGDNAGVPDFTNVIATVPIAINMNIVPTNFTVPVTAILNTSTLLPIGTYYVEIDGNAYTFSAGNFLTWQAQASGTNDLFNRDPAVNAWSTDNPLRVVGYDLIKTIKGFPVLALAANREVEITTLIENDLQSVVASKLQVAVNNDVQFVATVNTNKVTVENIVLGNVTDANVGDTGFFADIIVQGTDTDLTGIEDIENKNIRQLGTGSGSGGGSGDSISAINRFQLFLDDSDFSLAAVNSFKSKTPTALVDTANSTGSFSIPTKTFNIEPSEILQTIELTDFNSIAKNSDINELAIRSYWNLPNIDPNAIHRVSRMGGLVGTYQDIVIKQVGSTDVIEGFHSFTEEKSNAIVSNQTLSDLASTDLDSVSNQVVSQEIVLASETNLDFMNLFITRIGSFVGKFNIALVLDDGLGNPDLTSVIAQRGFFNVSDIALVETSVKLDINKVLQPATYHFVILTDSTYKTNYVNGVTEISLSTGTDATLPNLKTFDGTIFTTAGLNASLKYELDSSALILQTIEENPLANNVGELILNNTAQLQIGQAFTWNFNRITIKQLQIEVNKATIGAIGSMIVKIVEDNGSGDPDLTKILSSKTFDIASLVTGIQVLTIDTNEVSRSVGTAHIVIETDQVYKDHFAITPVDFISFRADVSPPIEPGIALAKTFNGTVWAGVTNTSAGFLISGRILSLILQVQSTLVGAQLSAFGIAYEAKPGVITTATGLPIAFTTIQPTVNAVTINLSSLAPLNLSFLKAFFQDGGGQQFMFPEFDIVGDNVVFQAGTFNVPNAVPIRFEQFTPEVTDANPALIDLMRENFLGGLVGLDFAFPGRGPKMRADDGKLVEIQITSSPRTIRIVDQE